MHLQDCFQFMSTWNPLSCPHLATHLVRIQWYSEVEFHLLPVKLCEIYPKPPVDTSVSNVHGAPIVPTEEIANFFLQKNRTRLRCSFHCPKIAMASPFQPLL